jgi:hypothetical protein
MGDDGAVRGVFDAAAKEPGTPGGSPLARWLLANAQDFATELAKVRRPNWQALARALFDKAGVAGRDGQLVAGETLRQAWYRVRLYLDDRGSDWVTFAAAPKVRRRKRAADPKVGHKQVKWSTDPRELTPGTRPVEPVQFKSQAAESSKPVQKPPVSPSAAAADLDEMQRKFAAIKPWLTSGGME